MTTVDLSWKLRAQKAEFQLAERDRELQQAREEIARLKAEIERSKMTFFYVRNLSHQAWRDPQNLELICTRIEDYAKMEYDLLESALHPVPEKPKS